MKYVKQYLGIILGVFLIILPVRTMFAPHDIAGGGISGLAIVFNRMFGFEMSLTTLIINGVLLILGTLVLGKGFLAKTAFGTLLVPVFLQIIPNYAISNDVILSVFFGSLLTAIGVDVLYRVNASSGGTTIPPLILKKKFGMSPSIGLFISDFVIVALSWFVFGLESVMYSVLVLMMTSLMMEYIANGISRKKIIYILSDNPIDIEKESMAITNRGATRIKATGSYSGKDKEILMIVCNDRDLNQIQEIVKEKDPKAFCIVVNAASVTGEGFSYQSSLLVEE